MSDYSPPVNHYADKDDALAPMHEHLEALVPMAGSISNDALNLAVSKMTVDMPIELDVLVETDGHLSLASSPPLHYVETGFAPNHHRMRIVIAAEQLDEGVNNE